MPDASVRHLWACCFVSWFGCLGQVVVASCRFCGTEQRADGHRTERSRDTILLNLPAPLTESQDSIAHRRKPIHGWIRLLLCVSRTSKFSVKSALNRGIFGELVM